MKLKQREQLAEGMSLMRIQLAVTVALTALVVTTFNGHLLAADGEASTASPASAAGASVMKYSYAMNLKNTGVLPKASGKLTGKYSRAGAAISQQSAISAADVLPGATHDLTSLSGAGSVSTVAASLTSDAKGKIKAVFSDKSGRNSKPLPDALNPLIAVRALNIASAGQILLSGDVLLPDKLRYQYKGPFDNTGIVSAAAGVLQLKATEKSSQFGLKVSGLPAATDCIVLINSVAVQTVASDKKGKLNLKSLPAASPTALNIHSVALAIGTSGNIVLSVKGLGVPPDNAAPAIIATTPADTSTDVPTNVKISALFSKAVASATITTSNFTVTGPGTTPVAGSINYDKATNRATFVPATLLATSTLFTATLAAGVQDFSGNATATSTTWTFTTGLVADAGAPFVVSTNPADAATNVPLNRPVTATFNKTMDASTINSSTFKVQQGSSPVSGTVTYGGTTATFMPAANLALNSSFTGTISTSVTDLAGNELASTFTWTFTTGSTSAAGPAPVVLASCNTFAVLAGSTVTSVGPTQLNGDMGISPGTAFTGFPPGIVTGTIHAGDNAAAQAKNDLLTAYNDGAGRLGAAVLPGNLGGLTFTPGLYKNSTSTMISGTGSNGILTLDAQGDANAVFIFQMGSTLTTDPNTQIVLSGNAKAANVYWQVGTSATLGTDSIFKGNILADQSITLTTRAVLEGRALTRIGAVALDSNTITVPAP
jgi:hypothetical protein